MRRVVIRDNRDIYPFHEPARDLRVLNKPLKVHQRDVLVKHCQSIVEYDHFDEIPHDDREPMLVYQDNLFFDQPFIDEFVSKATQLDRPCRVAFGKNDRAITRHALELQDGIRLQGDVYIANMWYFPNGVTDDPEPLVIDTDATEMGNYHVPTYMADENGEIVYYVPKRAFLSIEHWYHIFVANTPFGIWAIGARFEAQVPKWSTRLKLLWRGIVERKQVLSTSDMVHVGKNTHINPSAHIQGPTFIGDNCYIGPNVMIQNSVIGNNVNLQQDAQVMLSVISDSCYLPFRGAVFMSTLMERCIVAQNSCLQLCVLGRGTFVGAGTTFTDFNLVPKPVLTLRDGRLESTGATVVGGCAGHNCRLGSGLVIYPGRVIESDTVLVRSEKRGVVTKNVSYEQSDHHQWKDRGLHKRLYGPNQEK